LTDPQTLNLYAYVRNNPLAKNDPDGHCCWDYLVGFAKGTANQMLDTVKYNVQNGYPVQKTTSTDNTNGLPLYSNRSGPAKRNGGWARVRAGCPAAAASFSDGGLLARLRG
jgi:hypothetical protein